MSSLVTSGASAAVAGAALASTTADASTSADLATVEGAAEAGASDMVVRRVRTDGNDDDEERRTVTGRRGLADVAALAATVASRAPLRAALAI